MFWTSLLVNVGMWIERYLLIVTPLSLKQPFVFTWVEAYVPRPLEYLLSLAFLALVALGLLLFARAFPIVPIWDVKEGQLTRRNLRIGRRSVPAAIHE
jgi:molybdopterin-containing oxidoreductase family membrane subunit